MSLNDLHMAHGLLHMADPLEYPETSIETRRGAAEERPSVFECQLDLCEASRKIPGHPAHGDNSQLEGCGSSLHNSRSNSRTKSAGLRQSRADGTEARVADDVAAAAVADEKAPFQCAKRRLKGLIPFSDIISYKQEFSGMLGDLGTGFTCLAGTKVQILTQKTWLGLYIPLVVALSLTGQISLGATLIFSGLSNIITGFTFTIPMCVQPMKSIAAVALAQKLSNSQIMASGILTGSIVAAVGITNLISIVNRLVPNSVVRGLQMGLGLSFFKSALQMIPDSGKLTWEYERWVHWDGLLPAALSLAFALVFVRSRRVPVALLLFAVGFAVAAARLVQNEKKDPIDWGITRLSVVQFKPADWIVGLLQGALPQVPTTLLNSCIAVCQLADDLYPHRNTGVNVRAVATSVGLMNVVFCWFGALPMCHGAGGLAGQHRFGARTNLSVIVLGASKLLLGLFLAGPLLQTLRFFPHSILAALLAIAAFELAAAARSAMTEDADSVRLCLLTCCFTLFCGTDIGFLLGVIAALCLGITGCFVGSEESVASSRALFYDYKAKVTNSLEFKSKVPDAERHGCPDEGGGHV